MPGLDEVAGAACRTQGEGLLPRSPVCCEGLTQKQTEELPGAGSGEGAPSSMPSQGLLSPHLHVLANPGALQTCPFGFLWGLHDKDVINEIIGPW